MLPCWICKIDLLNGPFSSSQTHRHYQRAIANWSITASERRSRPPRPPNPEQCSWSEWAIASSKCHPRYFAESVRRCPNRDFLIGLWRSKRSRITCCNKNRWGFFFPEKNHGTQRDCSWDFSWDWFGSDGVYPWFNSMAIEIVDLHWFTHSTWWFSIAMLVYKSVETW